MLLEFFVGKSKPSKSLFPPVVVGPVLLGFFRVPQAPMNQDWKDIEWHRGDDRTVCRDRLSLGDALHYIWFSGTPVEDAVTHQPVEAEGILERPVLSKPKYHGIEVGRSHGYGRGQRIREKKESRRGRGCFPLFCLAVLQRGESHPCGPSMATM